MDTIPCYCKKCKGSIVSRKTFHRHLVNENNLKYKNYVKPKQKATEKLKMKILIFIQINCYLLHLYQMNLLLYHMIMMILLQLLHMLKIQEWFDQFLQYLFYEKVLQIFWIFQKLRIIIL